MADILYRELRGEIERMLIAYRCGIERGVEPISKEAARQAWDLIARFGVCAAPREADSAHTPGPWVWSFESTDPEWAVVCVPHGICIANVNANHRQEANARLIAAAPKLLDSLRYVVRRLQNNLACVTSDIEEAMREAETVIAQAEGR